MKTSREELKSLVKVLLVEVLREGLGGLQPASPRRDVAVEARSSKRRAFDPRLDVPASRRAQSDAMREAVRREAGGNPMLADILADTAVTTLPTQISHGDSGSPGGEPHPGMQMHEQVSGELSDVFGAVADAREDGTSYWADLAFTPSKKQA